MSHDVAPSQVTQMCHYILQRQHETHVGLGARPLFIKNIPTARRALHGVLKALGWKQIPSSTVSPLELLLPSLQAVSGVKDEDLSGIIEVWACEDSRMAISLMRLGKALCIYAQKVKGVPTLPLVLQHP